MIQVLIFDVPVIYENELFPSVFFGKIGLGDKAAYLKISVFS